MTIAKSGVPLEPGSVIGIMGGGQLGRMLAMAAARLGLDVHVFDPSPDGPATAVARHATCARWDDAAALERFAEAVDVVTCEFENVPLAALDAVAAVTPLRPGRAAFAAAQDRILEKAFLERIGLAVAPHADIPDGATLQAALDRLGRPAILKTRRMGYDGHGQIRIAEGTDIDSALSSLSGVPAILEAVVPFTAEISVIGARAADGSVSCFDPGRNLHVGGILSTTTVPSGLPRAVLDDAVLTAGRILNALDYVGVIGVEFFVTDVGLVVNEIAPRVHNSGHWTQNGCTIDQFEQHVRAIAGWPLGDGARHADITMTNLIGADVEQATQLATDPLNALHLYGKAEARPGRKMGHVNRRTG